MKDRSRTNKFDEAEFSAICAKYNKDAWIKDVDIKYESPSYFYKVKDAIKRDRRAEVVFCVCRENENTVTVTCSEYPEGVYRIPTGGIRYGEDIVQAMFREVREELGLQVEVARFAGVVRIRFVSGKESIMFYSYVFILRETGGRLLLDATDDEISAVLEADISKLEEISEKLGKIEGRWSDWGKFRQVSTAAALDELKQMIECAKN